MKKLRYKFSNTSTDFYFDANFSYLGQLVDKSHSVIITDENIFNAHKSKFSGWNTIVLKPGEEYKIQATVDSIIEQLIAFEADRKSFLIGVGGGVVTDLTGYAASIYMRGLGFGFVPTSVLAMVDASIGGKNGIDVGVFKNLVGTIRQPEFLLYDYSFLRSLPQAEWVNGFAEIIKHACIKDVRLFSLLEKYSIGDFQRNKGLLSKLIETNAGIKAAVVQRDEFEQNERRLLNFGHTLGHALENQYELSHGQAISIGMAAACLISEKLNGFDEAARVIELLQKYQLPAIADFDSKKVVDVLKMDKKRERKGINYILLEKIGKGTIKNISLDKLKYLINNL